MTNIKEYDIFKRTTPCRVQGTAGFSQLPENGKEPPMKTVKKLFSVLILFISVICIGCSGDDHSDIRKAISAELDPLKDLDSSEAYSYLNQSTLFDDPSFSPDSSSEDIMDVFPMFFKEFNYEIESVDLSEESQTASATVRLTTIDAESLARDFAAASLRETVQDAAKNGGTETPRTTEERYLLLNHLLKTGVYDTVESECDIQLTETDDGWKVDHTAALENQLVGGLISYLADSYILSPESTLDIYLGTLHKMSQEELSSYLRIGSLSADADDTLSQIYSAIIAQVHNHFDYEVLGSTIDGTSADVRAAITTFDGNSIMEAYRAEMNTYLDSADAVIDGPDARLAYSRQLLLKHLKENTSTTKSDVTFLMENDGISWKPVNTGNIFGDALFGTIQIDTEE